MTRREKIYILSKSQRALVFSDYAIVDKNDKFVNQDDFNPECIVEVCGKFIVKLDGDFIDEEQREYMKDYI